MMVKRWGYVEKEGWLKGGGERDGEGEKGDDKCGEAE